MSSALKIGDLARRTACPVESIRFYEREGLLPEPARTAGNYRSYGREHVERLSFIRNCRLLDMTLDEIRQLLHIRDNPRGDCVATHALLDEHITHVAARITELQRLERDLKGLRRACRTADVDAKCAILAELDGQTAVKSPGKSMPHVRGAHRR
ncbi:MAG TPA: Cd(II)/Pb(II)-responsive transcriptional regulator [Steroidobacteraceae bacterium]|nr:Cd(II)/Pb(II)-responsive transcriptional regulator [Steroidobacteraceae bacterium]